MESSDLKTLYSGPSKGFQILWNPVFENYYASTVSSIAPLLQAHNFMFLKMRSESEIYRSIDIYK